MSESYASFGSTLGSIWIWPCSKSTYVSGWSTCFSIFRKNLGASNGWKRFGCLRWCTHSQNWAVNWLMDQSHPLRRKRRKIWSETKTGSHSKLLNDACHATAGKQSGGLLLGFNWTTFSKMTQKAFLFVCLFFALDWLWQGFTLWRTATHHGEVMCDGKPRAVTSS